MKNKIFSLLLLVSVLLSGCASFGQHTANVGQKIGQTGSGVLMASAATWVLIPVGLGIAIPIYVVASPVYYGGCIISHQKPEKDPYHL